MTGLAPLLSATADIKKDPDIMSKVPYPVLGSPKLDGIRNIVRNNTCVSRKLLDIPRQRVQELFAHLEHMDGELAVGDVTDHDVYNRTQSYVMSKKPRADEEVFFYVFDWAEESWAHRPYTQRLDHLAGYVQRYQSLGTVNLVLVPQRLIHNAEELLAFEVEMLELGYEGIMWRSPDGPYQVPREAKENRSTFKEGILVKLKRFEDIEAVVVGFVEGEHNHNEAKKDAFGRTKRSSAKAGMVPSGTLGKFIVSYDGSEHPVARGKFKKAELQYIWDHQDEFLGKFLKVRHFPHGAKDGLRHPRAIGWRSLEDMS